MPATRLGLLVLPVLTLGLLALNPAAHAGQPKVAGSVRADKPKTEVTYRIDYRGLAYRPQWGYFYSPTRRVIKHKGAAPTVVLGPAKLHTGWGMVLRPTSWRQFRTVDSPEAASRLCLSLQQMGLQTRVVRRAHHG